MAHIEKRAARGKSGKVHYRVRYIDPIGKERSKSFSRRVDADAFRKTVESDVAKGRWVDPQLSQTQFRSYAEDWRATLSHLAPTTVQNVDGRLRKHILPAFGNYPMSGIRPVDVRKWVHGLTASGLSPATVKSTFGTLAKIMRTAEVDGLIVKSPCTAIELPRDDGHKEMLFLSGEEVARLAETINSRYRALIYTAAYTGLRFGELAALRPEDINPLTGRIEIRRSLSEVNGKLHFRSTKTGKHRTVSLPRFLSQMLGKHMGLYPAETVFSSNQGLPLRRRNFYRRHYRPAVRQADLPEGLRIHDLRHTCVALLIKQGAHAKEIQERLGHSTIRLTFDRYGHLLPGLDDRLRDGLEATFQQASVASFPAATAQ